MAVTLNANTSTGFIATSDTSGVLQLQTAGTTAVTVDASQNTTLAGTLTTASRGIAKASMPAGTVLQVVQATYGTAVSTTSATQVTTGLSASITPSSTSSKILVMVTDPMRSSSGSVYGIRLNLNRNGSLIHAPMNNWAWSNPSGSEDKSYLATFNYLDSPSTTSAVTYNLSFAKASNDSYTVTAQIDSDTSTMILMEIAA